MCGQVEGAEGLCGDDVARWLRQSGPAFAVPARCAAPAGGLPRSGAGKLMYSRLAFPPGSP